MAVSRASGPSPLQDWSHLAARGKPGAQQQPGKAQFLGASAHLPLCARSTSRNPVSPPAPQGTRSRAHPLCFPCPNIVTRAW